ncbi:MAG: GAF domain-containing sensor histidine kinase [Caldilineaceae bacterium]|nr:GAF domain-containing sensor histidine kinase [Caldilineaceae bacterium]
MIDRQAGSILVPAASAEEGAHVFRFLLAFRWASLAPVPIAWLLPGLGWAPSPASVYVFLFLLAINVVLTRYYQPINQWLRRTPWLLGLDLALLAVILALTGGVASSFYFYTLSPILAAAFFFQLRGGLLAALAFTPLYLLAVTVGRAPLAPVEVYLALLEIFSFYLIAVLFGYPAILLEKLRERTARLAETGHELAASNTNLQHRNQQLHLIQELTLSLQSSVDPAELQEVLLAGLVDEMQFPTAVIALHDGSGALTAWLSRGGAKTETVAHAAELALAGHDCPITRAVATRKTVVVTDAEPPCHLPALDAALAVQGSYVVLPMYLRDVLVGVLLVGAAPDQPLTGTDITSLALVANHASVALGSLRLCIDRAQRLAAEEVRNRIAADIHDTVSQNLFGLAYGLNACNQLLAQDLTTAPAKVQAQLLDLEPLAFSALHQVRSAILGLLPGGMDRARFAAGLRKHMDALRMGKPVHFTVEVVTDFEQWPLELRHQLLLIAQEGVANIARHANAQQAWVVVDSADGVAMLTIRDNGRGFDPAQVTQVSGIGLDGVRRRVDNLGGTLHIQAEPGAGVEIAVAIPIGQNE